jgi:hypothetical protein
MLRSTRANCLGFALVALLLAFGSLNGCGKGTNGSNRTVQTPVGTTRAPQPGHQLVANTAGGEERFDVRGTPLGKGILIADGRVFDNLTIFPILAKEQRDIGPITSLDTALESGKAEVREINATRSPQPTARRPQYQQQQGYGQPANQPIQQVASGGGGARVDTLVIDNKGEMPIYVLAGTVVKGGKQDRQIGQDFIVPPHSKVPVDAFCVEHGRWQGTRQGVNTAGKFKSVKHLANAEVRAAAQYKSNQNEVWRQVKKVNAANRKSADSGTLMATLDDPEVALKRTQLAGKIQTYLAAVTPKRAVVGYAYAVDGKIKGVRWFINHRVFRLFQEPLVNTSAIDAITAQAGAPPKRPPALAAKKVVSFVENANKVTEKKRKETKGANVNYYFESDKAYGSSTKIRVTPKMPGKPAPAAVEVSSDYLAK